MLYITRRIASLLAGVMLVSSAIGQVQAGDLLAVQFDGRAHHVRRNGLLVRTIRIPGSLWVGGTFLPDGDILIARRAPSNGFLIFDGDTGAIRADVDVALPHQALATSIERLRDGSYVMMCQGGGAIRLDANGVQIGTVPIVSSAAFHGTVLDRDGNLWATSAWKFHKLNQDAQAIDQAQLAHDAGDLDIAQDGTVWTTDLWGPRAVHYGLDGTLLGSFPVQAHVGSIHYIAIGRNGTIVTGSYAAPALLRYTQDGTLIQSIPLPGPIQTAAIDIAGGDGTIGSLECDGAIPNSTGFAGWLRATGSPAVADSAFRLRATTLPTAQFGMFINSQLAGFAPNAGGSEGTLCLGGAIGRHTDLISMSDGGGVIDHAIDLGNLPTPLGVVAVAPGETWRFQMWFRDGNPTPTSNFTSVVAVTFQ